MRESPTPVPSPSGPLDHVILPDTIGDTSAMILQTLTILCRHRPLVPLIFAPSRG
jgi:hypothetical protein